MIFNLNKSTFGRNSFLWTGAEAISWADSGDDWMMAIPASGLLSILTGIPRADVCIVAAGKPGENGIVNGERAGQGGNGGGIVEFTDISLSAGVYNITVGTSGQNSIVRKPDGTIWTAASGQGAAGGSPGAGGSLAWNDPDTLLNPGWLYGAGGGHGAKHERSESRTVSYAGGSVGAASADQYAGHGGGIGTNQEDHQEGWAGVAGTGQGGGGGRYYYNGDYYGFDGGAGGSGIILIRKHKEAT